MAEGCGKQIDEADTLIGSRKTSEAVGAAVGVAGSGVAAGEAVAIEGVKGELVDIDSPAEDCGGGGEDQEQPEKLRVRDRLLPEGGLQRREGLLDNEGQDEGETDDEDWRPDEREGVERAGESRVLVGRCSAGEGTLSRQNADQRGSHPAEDERLANVCHVEEIVSDARTEQRSADDAEPREAEEEAPCAKAGKPLTHRLVNEVSDEAAADLNARRR